MLAVLPNPLVLLRRKVRTQSVLSADFGGSGEPFGMPNVGFGEVRRKVVLVPHRSNSLGGERLAEIRLGEPRRQLVALGVLLDNSGSFVGDQIGVREVVRQIFVPVE